MNKFLKTSLITIPSLFIIFTTQAAEPSDTASQQLAEIKNTCIVRFDDSLSKFAVERRARGMVAAANAHAKHIYKHAIKGFAVNLNCNKAKTVFAEQKDIVSFEADSLVVINPGPPAKKGKKDSNTATTQTIPWGVKRVGGPLDGTGLTAWILDTGIDLDNTDLNVDTDNCFSAFTSGKDKTCDDGHGHGTHVAGTVAAIDNTIDVVGVAAGATVVPVKVLNSRGAGSNSGVLAGIDHITNNASPGDCANLSLGGEKSDALNAAVISMGNLGIYVAVAAGNESQDANNVSPASAEGENVWTISAIDAADNFASFSNYGNPPVDYTAPGVAIESLKRGGGITSKNGTSMATPHACAVFMLTKGSPGVSGDAIGEFDGIADPIIHN